MVQHYYMSEDMVTDDLGDGVTRRILAYEDNLMVVEVMFEEGSFGAMHSHPHEQITYIIEGEFEFDIGGEKKVLKAGDSTYKEPEIIHGAVCLKKGKLLDIFTPHREDFVGGDK
ncbi:cupin domain-containing protein [Jeotgalibaca sp. MA1X17-3]|uniref:cupin domain-containing protein n=1 Tax=Jeotgalibaca sp. MA1X17-3 TaxID=2908211 RepID=UPI001F2BD591|nr:cupin domain-containing protein [Jeotgalibaca sp. MA1X17-3]UJF15711.1 cupin domain-containing protein [Jeotgalibaca sp. MA1X17-3]